MTLPVSTTAATCLRSAGHISSGCNFVAGVKTLLTMIPFVRRPPDGTQPEACCAAHKRLGCSSWARCRVQLGGALRPAPEAVRQLLAPRHDRPRARDDCADCRFAGSALAKTGVLAEQNRGGFGRIAGVKRRFDGARDDRVHNSSRLNVPAAIIAETAAEADRDRRKLRPQRARLREAPPVSTTPRDDPQVPSLPESAAGSNCVVQVSGLRPMRHDFKPMT